ncbi:MAG: 30S ribosomal protein S18, partial [Candidatus Portnoybacteria bacterium CG10_big_fil_rev_8_21_14_0_10_43_39]
EQDTELLRKFLSGQAKILSPRRTGVCAKHQRKVTKAIKKARLMGLLPFTVK